MGSVQHLKNKYGGGYSLELKLRNNNETLKSEIKSLVITTFPSAVIDEEFEERIIYKVPQKDIKCLANCFSMLEKGKLFFIVLTTFYC